MLFEEERAAPGMAGPCRQPGKVRVGIIPLREMAADITRRKIADGKAL